jgi:hypothetical protein
MSATDIGSQAVSPVPFRPTGHYEAEYVGHEEWSNPHWAWEFLRRNDAFQQWCSTIANSGFSSKAKDSKARREYGLINFKPYWEPFDGTGVRRARFVTSKIQSWSRVTKAHREELGIYPRIPLRKGEILIKFFVNASSKSTKSIAAQLRSAKIRLRQREKQWTGCKAKLRPNRHKHDLLTLLRLLDLYAYNVFAVSANKVRRRTYDEMYSIIFPRLTRGTQNDPSERIKFQKAFGKKKEAAEEYATDLYLDLAAS